VDTVPDPKIQEPTDVIIKITSTAICGSDLHLYDGFMMGMEKGAPAAYKTFRDKEDGCIKVVLKPSGQ
jgi:threonine dehydrogenase-like Zn-dependent dehydrogenase